MARDATATKGSDTLRAFVWGFVAAALVMLGIYFGSRRFRDFDTALVPYAGASVFAAFGIGYRYTMWLRRPPTRVYWFRGWQIFLSPLRLPANLALLARLLWTKIFAQTFIRHRSRLRWAAHWSIAWGCILAALVTFPLSFGWIRFETARDSQQIYETFVFGIRIFAFHHAGPFAPLIFNVLDIAAVMVIVGVGLALWRRAENRGALAVQQFGSDFMPLILLFAVSVTGLLLTVSAHWLRGFHYQFLAQFHAVTVIFTLVYLPFGKFFHIFQRPAQLSLDFYRRAGERMGQTACARCGQPFASQLHVGDLKRVEAALAIEFDMPGGVHYQDVCPACRRKSLAMTQDGLWRAARARGPKGM